MSYPENYINEAKRLEKSKSIFEYIWKDISNDRYEKISELYEKAGNIYKITDKSKAIKYLAKSYNNLIMVSGSFGPDELKIKKILTDIAELYIKIDYNKSIEYYEKIINYYTEKGDITNIIKIYEIIGNIYFDNNDFEKALEIYYKTIGIINSNDKSFDIKKNIVDKIGEIYYSNDSKINIFELSKFYYSISEDYLKKKLGYISARNYIFNGLLLNLASDDLVETKNNFEKYSNIDHTFQSSREGIFMIKLIEIFESLCLDEFTFLCGDYDKIKSFDKIQIKLLSKIKENIGGLTDIDFDNNNNNEKEQELDLC